MSPQVFIRAFVIIFGRHCVKHPHPSLENSSTSPELQLKRHTVLTFLKKYSSIEFMLKILILLSVQEHWLLIMLINANNGVV